MQRHENVHKDYMILVRYIVPSSARKNKGGHAYIYRGESVAIDLYTPVSGLHINTGKKISFFS